jgi:hypothetical protein
MVIASISRNPSSALGPGVYSTSNGNQCQREKQNLFLGSRARPVLKHTINLHLWVDCLDNVGSLTSKIIWAFTACYGDSFTFLYLDVRTSQEAQASTVCYGESFTFLYVDDVRTSQETRRITGIALLFYM